MSATVEEINDYVDIVLSEVSRHINTPFRPKDSYNKTVPGRPEIWAYFGDIAITGYESLQRYGNCQYEQNPLVTGITIYCNLTTSQLQVDIMGLLKHSTYPPRRIRAVGVFQNPILEMKLAVEPWKELDVHVNIRLPVPQVKVVNLGEEAKFNSIRLGYRDEIIAIMQSSQWDVAKQLKIAADSELIPYKK